MKNPTQKDDLDIELLNAYSKGYASGWNDAKSTIEVSTTPVSEATENNILLTEALFWIVIILMGLIWFALITYILS